MSQPDPSTLNQLGKGVLCPELEARLIASGYVFARRLPSGGLLRGRRALGEAAQDMLNSTAKVQRLPRLTPELAAG